MSKAISAANLSKRYRIGSQEERQDTLVSAVTAFVSQPVKNLQRLRRLTRFEEDNGDSSIWALKDVSFEVKRGEVVGIVGRNGAGKSTLLKILSRITYPSSGRVELRGRVSSLLEVGTGFHPELTGRENIYLNGTILGMRKAEIDRKLDEIVDFSGVAKFIDTPVKRYSSGMRVRLAFSVAAHLEPEILLIDEVLAVGDVEFQKKCLGKMGDISQEGRTVVFVSHNMEAILDLCPSSFVLDHGHLVLEGKSEDAIQFYLRSFAERESVAEPHVLYRSTSQLTDSVAAKIVSIETLDGFHAPKPVTYTWDEVVVRIHYISKEYVANGSFILDFWDRKQQRLIVFDSGLQVPIKTGKSYIDCYIPQMPLAAGEYYVGAGLTISKTEWLWRERSLGTLRVYGKDVFSLGRPPQYQRMYFAVEHYWRE